MYALRDPALDWAHGGQMLHLTYVVETFLHDLVQRGAHFSVVFFESHRALWQHDSAMGVARALLIHHLRAALPATHTASLDTFPSPASPEWLAFFHAYLPNLVAVSDEVPMAPGAKISPVRAFLLDLAVAGVNLLLLRDIEITDHQVRGFYVPGRRGARQTGAPMSIGGLPTLYTVVSDGGEAEVEAFAKGVAESLGGDWTAVAFAWACSAWLAAGAGGGGDDKIAAVKLVVVHVMMLRHACLPLESRAHMLVVEGANEEPSHWQRNVLDVLSGVLKELAGSVWCRNGVSMWRIVCGECGCVCGCGCGCGYGCDFGRVQNTGAQTT